MTISVCMIVKNEEKNLERAMESLNEFADEIVIVDTGSLDGTKQVARRLTPLVYEFEMNGDFAAARNFAFSKCSMDYIYSADADEVVDEQNRDKIMALKESLPEEIDIVQMKYSNQLQFGSVYNFDVEYRPKLFRRLRTFRWMDPVHEVIDTQVHMLDSDITIVHMPAEQHADRDFGIFQRYTQSGKRISGRLHRLYAQELFLSGKDEDFLNAYDYFERTLHEQDFPADGIRQSQCVVARCCAIRSDSYGLFKVALKNAVGEPSAEICCELGRYFQSCEDDEEAATWYYTAAFGAECELNAHCAGDIPLIGLAECMERLENHEESLKYRGMAEKWHPKGPED